MIFADKVDRYAVSLAKMTEYKVLEGKKCIR